MQIFVRLATGRTITVDTSRDDKISALKEKIGDKTGMEVKHQVLLWAGKKLADDDTLEALQIVAEMTLFCIEKIEAAAAVAPVVVEASPWECMLCGTPNGGTDVNCNICFGDRPPAPTSAQPPPPTTPEQKTSGNGHVAGGVADRTGLDDCCCDPWLCTVCSSDNGAMDDECVMCANPRPVPRGPWVCPTCSSEEPATAMECGMCAGPRPDDEGEGSEGGTTKVASAPPRTCPRGHALALYSMAGGSCDGCRRKLPRGSTAMDCRPCNYDLCDRCDPRAIGGGSGGKKSSAPKPKVAPVKNKKAPRVPRACGMCGDVENMSTGLCVLCGFEF